MNTDNQNVNDEKLLSHVRNALDDSVNRIDAETSQRIVAARKQALNKAPRRFSLPKFFAAAATAMSIFIVVIVANTQFSQIQENTEAELVATQDTTELYEELEFYTWLMEEDVTS